MIHGPCNEPGTMHRYACRKNHIDGPCQRNYPHDFNSSTSLNEGCFLNYPRRRECEGGYVGTKILMETQIPTLTIDGLFHITPIC